jgi:hypothetical protein
MTAKWMRIERVTLLDGIFAVIVAALLCVLLFEDQLPISASGADNSKSNLVPYFVTWRVTGRGYYQRSSAKQVFTARDIWDIAGSAITRFRNRSGLMPLDTHYLTVTARRDQDIWIEEYATDCFSHIPGTMADTGSYSGSKTSINPHEIPMLFMGTSKQRNGATISFYQPFITLVSMKFIGHTVEESSCGSGAPISDTDQNPLGQISPSSPDLFADRDDASSFSVDTRYTTASGGPGLKTEVHWTAHAYLMGKCAERDGPIQEGDPIITHEQVDVEAEDPVIKPDGDGKTNVKIRVTCDRVPIQNAEVEVKLEVENKSGYHNHEDDNRPLGQLDGKEFKKDSRITLKTDDNGYAYAPSSQTKAVKFEPPPLNKSKSPAVYGPYAIGIAGTYKVTAKTTSKRVPESTGTGEITARYDGLIPMDSSSGGNYILVRNGVDEHEHGQWGSPGTLQAFKSLAEAVKKYQDLNNAALTSTSCGNKNPWKVYPLSINDIALPDGGLFDLDSNWTTASGHQTHNRGQGGDFNRFPAAAGIAAGTECDGTQSNIQNWLAHVLLYLGTSYGTWDCRDLQMNTAQLKVACEAEEFKPELPHLLHLHVED